MTQTHEYCGEEAINAVVSKKDTIISFNTTVGWPPASASPCISNLRLPRSEQKANALRRQKSIVTRAEQKSFPFNNKSQINRHKITGSILRVLAPLSPGTTTMPGTRRHPHFEPRSSPAPCYKHSDFSGA